MAAWDQRFAEFYRPYPRKGYRDEASRAWAALGQKHLGPRAAVTPEDLFQNVMFLLKRRIDNEWADRGEKGKMPYASRFLRGERFDYASLKEEIDRG